MTGVRQEAERMAAAFSRRQMGPLPKRSKYPGARMSNTAWIC
jgi:hypothetical protein